MRYRFIDTHKKVWPINLMCGVLDVSRSGFYHWQGRGGGRASERVRTGSWTIAYARYLHCTSNATEHPG